MVSVATGYVEMTYVLFSAAASHPYNIWHGDWRAHAHGDWRASNKSNPRRSKVNPQHSSWRAFLRGNASSTRAAGTYAIFS